MEGETRFKMTDVFPARALLLLDPIQVRLRPDEEGLPRDRRRLLALLAAVELVFRDLLVLTARLEDSRAALLREEVDHAVRVEGRGGEVLALHPIGPDLLP